MKLHILLYYIDQKTSIIQEKLYCPVSAAVVIWDKKNYCYLFIFITRVLREWICKGWWSQKLSSFVHIYQLYLGDFFITVVCIKLCYWMLLIYDTMKFMYSVFMINRCRLMMMVCILLWLQPSSFLFTEIDVL